MRMTTMPTTIKRASSQFDPIGTEMRMRDAFMKAADAFDKKHTKTKTAALAQLRKEGVLTRSGKLTKRYGG